MSTSLNTPEGGQFRSQFIGKIIHLALPVRWSLASQPERGPVATACTYDIYPRGARMIGVRPANLGDLVMVERGRSKALCQVIWVGDPDTSLRGQFAVQCVENRSPWEEELRHMEEQYDPVVVGARMSREVSVDKNRRRRPRFCVKGQAEVVDGRQQIAAQVLQISEYGARICAPEVLRPGAGFRLQMEVLDVTLALKAQVKHLHHDRRMGVEFQEIRRGDRPMLSYVLSKLRTIQAEEFVPVEVIPEPLVAVG